MASENTVEIGFTADTSGFTDGTDAASASIADLGQQATQNFAAIEQQIQALTAPTQAAAAAMKLYNDNIDQAAQQSTAGLLSIQKALIQQQKTLGDISASDAADQLISLAQLQHQQSNDSGQAEAQRYAQQMIQLNTEAAKASQAAWDGAFAPISHAFSSSIDGMVRGTQTLQQAMQHVAQNIVAEYANTAVQTTLKWVEGEAQKTLATDAGNAARMASNSSASTQGLSIEGEANKESVIGNAWSAAAAVYNNVAQIPYVGWVLAPAAAATAAAAVLAFGSSIPSAAGGWVVPNDTMAMVHQNEMILPAHLSQGIAGMIANGGSGGGHTFNNTFNVHAGDGVSAQQLPDMIVRTMSKALRNGQFGGMRTA